MVPKLLVRLAISPAELASNRVELISAVDQAGHNLLVQEVYIMEGNGDALFELKRMPGSRTARLVFGVRKSYLVDFLARPALVR